MREIKLRAWNTSTKGMKTNKQTLELLLYGNDFNYPIMQYTGLRDCSKSQVETYEDDIVKMTDGDGWELGIGLVVFKNGKFVIVHKDGLDCDLCNIPFEVIGNNHEHPHLLGDNNENR